MPYLKTIARLQCDFCDDTIEFDVGDVLLQQDAPVSARELVSVAVDADIDAGILLNFESIYICLNCEIYGNEHFKAEYGEESDDFENLDWEDIMQYLDKNPRPKTSP